MKEKFKVKAVKYFLIFIVIMLVMTFISRMVYVSKLPRVMTTKIKTQALSHSVKCNGILEAVKRNPVIVPEGLRVSEVVVKPGDKVLNGDLLLQFDKEYLSEKISDLEKEIKSELETLPGAYDTTNKIPIFTQPDLRISEVYVKQGDSVQIGQELIRLDYDYLYDMINSLQNDLNSDLITRDGYYENDDNSSADALTNIIDEKQRKIDKYNAIASNGGVVYSSISGVVTDLNVTAGSITLDSAIALISEDPKLSFSISEKKTKLEKLKKVAEADGKIVSLSDGVISEVFLSAGDFTTETAAFIISDTSAGTVFTANITEEDIKYIAVGDIVSISFRNGKVRIDDCEVTLIIKGETEGSYKIEIPVVNEQLNIGEVGHLSTSVLSDQVYNCLPYSAVSFENNTEMEGYVYVIEEIEGFLGTEYIVHKNSISIDDKNDTFYGTSSIVLDNSAYIVLSSSKELSEGQKVRLA